MSLDIDFLVGNGVEVEEGTVISNDWNRKEFLEMLECLENYVGYPYSRRLIGYSEILGYDFNERELYRKLVLRSVPPGDICDLPFRCYVSIEALKGCIDERSRNFVA